MFDRDSGNCRARRAATILKQTAIAWLLAAPVAHAWPQPQQSEEIPTSHLVLRLSAGLLNSLMEQGFQRDTEVRDNILGTEIYGRARIVANPAVQLRESPDQATFYVVIQGTAHSRSTGYNGPAILYNRSVTNFTATKQVVFDPGRGFYALPPQVQARTQTYLDGVGSTRRGIVGRIVRRRANQQATARHDESQEIAQQKAERRIAAAFDRHVEQRLARLNRAAEFRSLAVAALRPNGNGEVKYVCCSTPGYLQIATNFGAGGRTIDLPVKSSASATAAPVEIWIHKSLVGDKVASALQLLHAQAKASDLALALSAAARVIERQSSRPTALSALAAEAPVRVREVADWYVVEVEVAPDTTLAAVTARRG
jgi:hypothetical protein